MRPTYGGNNVQCPGYNLGRILVLFGCLFVGTALGAEETKTNTQTSFEKLVKDSKRIDGLLPLYKKEDKLTIEVPSKLLGKEFFITISIAQGIGSNSLLGGMSWGDGDDWVWTFRKRADKLQILR